MASFTTTENRPDSAVPFFNENVIFADKWQKMNTAFEEAGITVSTDLSLDGLSIKYIRTFPEEKTLEFKSIYETFLNNIKEFATLHNYQFPIEQATVQEFDSLRTEQIFKGEITL